VYICMLVFLLQSWIFAELVGVRKKQAAERKLPLFRSLQWAWFLVAAFFTWSANVCEFIGKRPKHFAELESESWSAVARFMLEKNMMISFSMYMGLMIVSVLSLRKGLYKYQIQQYTWTIVTICIVVFQTQAVFQIVYAGLFWFVLPSSLVICNDIMAYYCGQLLGKKLTSRKFLELSPNKTWEGFMGSAICTMVFAFFFSKWLCGFDWMTCVPEDMTLKLDKLTCTPAQMYRPLPLRVFLEDSASLREPVREVLAAASRNLPSVVTEVEVCAAQLHALCLGLFASFAAPFGGFLSSAIKRAYGIKDFNNLIPGHGGMMDRFDCQFVMFLCTFVHHRTFCYSPISVDALLAGAAQLSLAQQKEVVKRLQAQLAAQEVGLR
jgi:phosphatidate cytidylyltransferase